MTGVYTELENVYAGKSVSPLRGGSSVEPEGPGQTEAYGRSLSPLTLPPLTGTLRPKRSFTCTHIHTMRRCFQTHAFISGPQPFVTEAQCLFRWNFQIKIFDSAGMKIAQLWASLAHD